MENEIILVNTATLAPAMDMQQALQTYQAMVDFVKGIMQAGVDFGTIPGTDKPTLYKPGAEKLLRFFGLSVRFEMTKEVEQWEGEEPFFYYRYSASLYRISDGILIAQGEGSCNSHEKKYRYRNGEHTCPECGKTAIIKGKKEYGGGWLCWGKKGGCGSKFDDDSFGPVQQVLNPDIADLVNTLQKMAQKRALIAATLIGCNASEYFTQDIEDFVDGTVTQQPTQKTEPEPVQQPVTTPPTAGHGPYGAKNLTNDSVPHGHGPNVKGNYPPDEKLLSECDGKELHELMEYGHIRAGIDHPKHFDNRWKKLFGARSLKDIDLAVGVFLDCMRYDTTDPQEIAHLQAQEQAEADAV